MSTCGSIHCFRSSMSLTKSQRLHQSNQSSKNGGGSVAFVRSEYVSSCRVLEVDDDLDVADSHAMLLRCLGADVQVAYDGAAALAMVPQFKPHLVITDIGMPGMDGCETARRIRELPDGEKLVLVALTAWDHDAVRRRITEAGFDHHFVKPIQVDALEKLLASLDVT